ATPRAIPALPAAPSPVTRSAFSFGSVTLQKTDLYPGPPRCPTPVLFHTRARHDFHGPGKIKHSAVTRASPALCARARSTCACWVAAKLLIHLDRVPEIDGVAA